MGNNSSPENALETNLQPDPSALDDPAKLDDLSALDELASLENPDVYYRSLLKNCQDETLSHYLYQNREDETKMESFFQSPDWSSFSVVLSDDDHGFASCCEHFRELCRKIETLQKEGPEKVESDHADDEEKELTADEYYEKISKIPAGSFEHRVSMVIQIVLLILAFFALFIIDTKTKTDPTVMKYLYIGLTAYFGICLLFTVASWRGGSYEGDRQKSMKQWVQMQNRKKEQAKINARNEFNSKLRNLEKQRWDTYTRMQEAENAYLHGSRSKATSVREAASGSASLSGKSCANCGGNMSFDPRKKLLICPFCGNTRTLTDTTDAYTLKDLDTALSNEQYNKASTIVVELRKKDPENPGLLARNFCCSLRARSVYEALSSKRKLPGELQRVLDWNGWEQFNEAPSTKARAFSNHCRSFCERSMLLLGVKPRKKRTGEEHSAYVPETEPIWIFLLKMAAVALAFIGVIAAFLYFAVNDEYALYKITCCLAVLAGIFVYIILPLKTKYQDMFGFQTAPKNISGLSGNDSWEEKKRKIAKAEKKKEEKAMDELLELIGKMEKELNEQSESAAQAEGND